MDEKPRRRFQFGLASLFVLTTVAALAVWLGPEKWKAAMYGLAAVCGVLAVVRLAMRFVRQPESRSPPPATHS